jgi:hypothetical protein
MRNTNLWQGVVGFWSASAGPSGYRLLDRSGRGNHGTLTNMDAATDWVVDGGRYALDFDGSNDLVDISFSAFAGVSSATISGWFRRTATSAFGPMFGTGQSGTAASRFNVLAWSDGNVYVATNSNEFALFASNDLLLHHILVVFDGLKTGNTNRLKVYFDGKEVTLSYNGTVQSTLGNGNNWWMGITQLNQAGTGRIFENIGWTRSLSANEALQLYQIGRGGMLTPPRRRRAYFVQTFSPSWASGSNVVLQPSIGVS